MEVPPFHLLSHLSSLKFYFILKIQQLWMGIKYLELFTQNTNNVCITKQSKYSIGILLRRLSIKHQLIGLIIRFIYAWRRLLINSIMQTISAQPVWISWNIFGNSEVGLLLLWLTKRLPSIMFQCLVWFYLNARVAQYNQCSKNRKNIIFNFWLQGLLSRSLLYVVFVRSSANLHWIYKKLYYFRMFFMLNLSFKPDLLMKNICIMVKRLTRMNLGLRTMLV